MSPPIKQGSFSGGEIAPFLYARSDYSAYEKSLRTMRNFISMRHGCATGRPGTMFVGETLNGGNPVRLIPFIFNETGLGQSYVLEFGSEYIAFYQDGGVVVSIGTTPYTIPTPYQQSDLADLNFDESGDIVTIVHPSYPPAELKRFGPINWTLTDVVFGPTIAAPSGVSSSPPPAGIGTPYHIIYQITAVSDSGEESIAGGTGGNYLAVPTVDAPVSVSWGTVTGAAFYNVYKTTTNGEIGGFVGVAASPNFVDDGTIIPDYTNTPPIYGNPYSSTDNYPSVVGYIQQRRGFANTNNNPIGFGLSQPGRYSNFNVSTFPKDSDAIFGSIAGQEVNAIQALIEIKFMLMLTTGSELYVQGNGTGVVTPSAINASTQSQYGCGDLHPLKVGDLLLFKQALGSFIRDFVFDFAIDGYRGNDITVFASHFFEGHQIVDWGYQKTPDSIIWAVRDDGVMLGCTYVREQQVLAWHKHDFVNGLVENVCCIPENGEYAVYVVIKRVINGSTVRYLERMSSRIWTDPIEAKYLDCYSTFDGRNTELFTIAQYQIIAGVNDAIDLQLAEGLLNYTAYIGAGSYTGASLATAIALALNAIGITSNGNLLQWGCTFTGTGIDIWQSSVAPSALNYKLLWATGAHVSSNAAISLGWTLVDTPFSDDPGPNQYDLFSPNAPAIARSYLITMTLSATPSFETGDDSYQQDLTLTSSNSFFTSDMVGSSIYINDADWDTSSGVKGTQLRCIIQAFTSSTVVTVNPNRTVPDEFQAIPTSLWEHAVMTVSGLDYLEGQEVSVWADRHVVGSPLNSQISNVYTVTNGAITLDKWYAVIYVGLPMIQDIETLDLETSAGETIMDARKRSAELAVYTYNTRSFFGGTENPDTNTQNLENDYLFQLYELKRGEERANYNQPMLLVNETDYVILEGTWNKNGRIFIRNVDPVPVTILAISPQGENAAPSPFYLKA